MEYGECLAASVGTEEIPKYTGITTRARPLCGAQTARPPGHLACVRVADKEPVNNIRNLLQATDLLIEAQFIPRLSGSSAPVSLLLFLQFY